MTKETFDIITSCVNTVIIGFTGYFIYRAIYMRVDIVPVSRDLNIKQRKDEAKSSLFLLLFSLRGSPLHYDFVRGLNQIEVVFEDVPQVIAAWRQYFASLSNKGQVNAQQSWEIERAALLSAMAVHLGYSNIPHGELLRDYYPEGHDNQLKEDREFRQAQLLFFQSNTAMAQMVMDGMVYKDSSPEKLDGQQQGVLGS